MKIFFKNFWLNHKSGLIVFIALAAVIFVAGYWHANSIGLYSDDWGASTYLFQHTLGQAVVDWWHHGSGDVTLFRFLVVATPILWYWAFGLFGSTGVVLLNYVCFVGLAFLFFLLLKKHVSLPVAFAGALLFALYPCNNAYLWQVTMSYTLALLAMFGALLCYYRGRYFWSVLLLVASVFLNEAVLFLFVLALLPPGSVSWPQIKVQVKTWLKLMIPVLVLYVGIRLVSESLGITGGDRTVYVLQHFQLIPYLRQFITGEAVVLVIAYAAIVWKILHAFSWSSVLVGLFTAFVAWWTIRGQLTSGGQERALTRTLYLVLAGAILICAGRYYGFYYIPSFNVLNLDTRYYFAASVGGAVLYAGVLQWLLERFGRRVFIVLFSITILVLSMARWEVQQDYAAGFRESSRVWQQLLAKVAAPAAGTFIVVDIPDRELGKPVGLLESLGDLRDLMPKLYNGDVAAASSPYIQNLTISGNQTCVDSTPLYNHACFPSANFVYLRWENSQLTLAQGNPALLTEGPDVQSVPKNFLKALHLQP